MQGSSVTAGDLDGVSDRCVLGWPGRTIPLASVPPQTARAVFSSDLRYAAVRIAPAPGVPTSALTPPDGAQDSFTGQRQGGRFGSASGYFWSTTFVT
jgi:hypothetical protein